MKKQKIEEKIGVRIESEEIEKNRERSREFMASWNVSKKRHESFKYIKQLKNWRRD